MSSPTQRTLAFLRKRGYMVGITERWNRFAFKKNDLFGFIDLVAVHPGARGVLGVQATSRPNVLARVYKIADLPLIELNGKKVHPAKLWLQTGNRILVIGWGKKGPRGKAKRWKPSFYPMDLEELKRLREGKTVTK